MPSEIGSFVARSAYVSIRHTSAYGQGQHTSAYVIRQHTSAYVSIRQHAYLRKSEGSWQGQHTSAYVIRQHTSAYVSIRQHTFGNRKVRGKGDGDGVFRRRKARILPDLFQRKLRKHVSIRQHTSAYAARVSIRQHTCSRRKARTFAGLL
jgi:hypothetical protein